MLYHTVTVNRELRLKAKFSIYQFIYFRALTYSHVMTERTWLQIQVAKMSFFSRVLCSPLQKRSDIRKELKNKAAASSRWKELVVVRWLAMWFGNLIRMPPGHLPVEVFWAHQTGKRLGFTVVCAVRSMEKDLWDTFHSLLPLWPVVENGWIDGWNKGKYQSRLSFKNVTVKVFMFFTILLKTRKMWVYFTFFLDLSWNKQKVTIEKCIICLEFKALFAV